MQRAVQCAWYCQIVGPKYEYSCLAFAHLLYIILDTIVDKIYMGSTWKVHGGKKRLTITIIIIVHGCALAAVHNLLHKIIYGALF